MPDVPPEELLRADQRLIVDEGETEAVGVVDAPVRPFAGVVADVPVAADHAAQPATLVVVVVRGRFGESPGAHQLVVQRQVRPLQRPCSAPMTCFQPRSLRKR